MTDHEFDNGLDPDLPDEKEERKQFLMNRMEHAALLQYIRVAATVLQRFNDEKTTRIFGRSIEWEDLDSLPKHTDEQWRAIKSHNADLLWQNEAMKARIKKLTYSLESHGPEGHNISNAQHVEICDHLSVMLARNEELEAYINVLEVDLGEWMESTHPKITADEIKKHLTELEVRK